MARTPKGTPTDTNLFALSEWFVDGQPARIATTSLPHVRRCLHAGLVDIVGGVPRLNLDGAKAIEDKVTAAADRAQYDLDHSRSVRDPRPEVVARRETHKANADRAVIRLAEILSVGS